MDSELRRKCEKKANEIIREADSSPNYSSVEDLIAEVLLQKEMEIEMVKNTLGLSQKCLGEMKQYNHDKREEIKFLQEELLVAREALKLAVPFLPKTKSFDGFALKTCKQALQQIGEA